MTRSAQYCNRVERRGRSAAMHVADSRTASCSRSWTGVRGGRPGRFDAPHPRLGVVPRPRALYSGCAALELVRGGVANGYFLVHAPRPPTETSIEAADQRALNRRSCAGIGETA
jgi:hypothetical protein